MAVKHNVRLWYDKEGDFLEVLFQDEPGTFEETENDLVMVRVNDRKEVIGFMILSVGKLEGPYLDMVVEPSETS